MPDIYTRHVRGLGSAEDHLDDFWAKFLQDIRSELKNRHLLDSLPCFLGSKYDEYKTWHDPAAINALATDCYMAAVLKPLVELRAMLNYSPSVAGAVRTNMKFFLIDRQREANPIGYKIFKRLEKILLAASDEGRLRLQGSSEGKLANETIVQLELKAQEQQTSLADLERHIDSSELWSRILDGIAGSQRGATHLILDGLDELRTREVWAFRVGDLVTVLRNRTRPVDRCGGEKLESLSEISRTILAKHRYEEVEDAEKRHGQIFLAIDHLKRREQVRARIKRLFERLIRVDESPEEVVWETIYTELGFSRSTFWEYISVLLKIVKEIDGE